MNININNKLIVVGSKPYIHFNFNKIIDSFDNNMRCNYGVPNNNNGTRYDMLCVCITVMNILRSGYVKDNPVINYENSIKFIKNKSLYSAIFVNNGSFSQKINTFLAKIKSNFSFTKKPRTGIIAIFTSLKAVKKPFVTGFSIYESELYNSFYYNYTQDSQHSENNCHNDNKLERKIILYLHQENIIDASLCLLKDSVYPIFDIKFLNIIPSSTIIKKILYLNNYCMFEFDDVILNNFGVKIYDEFIKLYKSDITIDSNVISDINRKKYVRLIFILENITYQNFFSFLDEKNNNLNIIKKNSIILLNCNKYTSRKVIDNTIEIYLQFKNTEHFSVHNSKKILEDLNYTIPLTINIKNNITKNNKNLIKNLNNNTNNKKLNNNTQIKIVSQPINKNKIIQTKKNIFKSQIDLKKSNQIKNNDKELSVILNKIIFLESQKNKFLNFEETQESINSLKCEFIKIKKVQDKQKIINPPIKSKKISYKNEETINPIIKKNKRVITNKKITVAKTTIVTKTTNKPKTNNKNKNSIISKIISRNKK